MEEKWNIYMCHDRKDYYLKEGCAGFFSIWVCFESWCCGEGCFFTGLFDRGMLGPMGGKKNWHIALAIRPPIQWKEIMVLGADGAFPLELIKGFARAFASSYWMKSGKKKRMTYTRINFLNQANDKNDQSYNPSADRIINKACSVQFCFPWLTLIHCFC